MPQIFVFTAGNPEAREHLYASIETLSTTQLCSTILKSLTTRS
jgi:hypothetical protein